MYGMGVSRMGSVGGVPSLAAQIAAIFSGGQQGHQYDLPDFSTLFQDSPGTTPATTVEQVLGLILDKRLGLTFGPERVVNGSFSPSTNWVAGTAAVTFANGEAVFTNEAISLDSLYQLGIVPVGKYYEITYSITEYTSGSVRFTFGSDTAGTLRTAVGTYTQRVSNLISGNSNLIFKAFATGTTLKIDNVSVREILGNHISQATAPSRPVVSARVNLLLKSEQFGDPYWAKANVVPTANTLTATAGGGNVQRDLAIVGGQAVTVSVSILKTSGAVTFPMVALNGLTGTTAFAQVFLNTNTGVATARGEGLTPGPANVVVQNTGAHWKLSFSLITNATNTVLQTFIYPALSSDGVTVNTTLTGSIGVLGIQDEPGLVVNPYQRVNTTTDYDTAGFPVYAKLDGIDDSMSSSTGGGGTAGFFWCHAIKPTGGAGTVRTLWSDNGANSGYRVQLDALNQLSFSAGNGTAFTAIATATATAIGTTHLLTVWDDGTNLNAQLDSGAIATIARPVVTAGTAGFTSGKDNGAATGFFPGNIYSGVYRQPVPTAVQRAQVQAYARQKAGL